MISACGSVWGPVNASYLYAVVAEDCLYLGESSCLVNRWAGHLRDEGSSAFRRLNQLEGGTLPRSGLFAFFGLRCDVVESTSQEKRRLARRAIEEELHRQFHLNRHDFAPVERLLSTPPPPPIRHQFAFDVTAAGKMAYQLLANQHRQWRAAIMTPAPSAC